jgi:hypothetical protein
LRKRKRAPAAPGRSSASTLSKVRTSISTTLLICERSCQVRFSRGSPCPAIRSKFAATQSGFCGSSDEPEPSGPLM